MASLGGFVSCAVISTVVLSTPSTWFELTFVSVLFSVLVLHWITSKDNASTVSNSSLPYIRPVSTPPTKRSEFRPPLSRFTTYEFGMQEYTSQTPQVTTFVTASRDDDSGNGHEHVPSYPPNAITVSRNTVRAVDDVGPERLGSDTATLLPGQNFQKDETGKC